MSKDRSKNTSTTDGQQQEAMPPSNYMRSIDRVHSMAGDLEEYAKLDRTEYGEGSLLVADLATRDVGLSGKCRKALISELERRLQWYQDNTQIVKETHKTTSKVLKREYEYE
jgi:hypothetical protein